MVIYHWHQHTFFYDDVFLPLKTAFPKYSPECMNLKMFKTHKNKTTIKIMTMWHLLRSVTNKHVSWFQAGRLCSTTLHVALSHLTFIRKRAARMILVFTDGNILTSIIFQWTVKTTFFNTFFILQIWLFIWSFWIWRIFWLYILKFWLFFRWFLIS